MRRKQTENRLPAAKNSVSDDDAKLLVDHPAHAVDFDFFHLQSGHLLGLGHLAQLFGNFVGTLLSGWSLCSDRGCW